MVSTAYLNRLRAEEIARIAPRISAGARLLDLGAGTGQQALELQRRGFVVTAADLPQSDYAATRVFRVIDYDGERLPFPDQSFDIVFSSNTLEHVRDLTALHREIKRVLRPGGRCIHVLPTPSWRLWSTLTAYPAALMRLIAALRGRCGWVEALRYCGAALLQPAHGERGHALTELWTFSPAWWRRNFVRNGFTVIHDESMGLFYTGAALFGPSLSFERRARLSGILGSACHLFELLSALDRSTIMPSISSKTEPAARRGALVLFEGLPPTVIDSQVLTHARLMRESFGIDLQVVAFACTGPIYEMSKKRLDMARQIASGPVILRRGMRPAVPGSLAWNRHALRQALAAVAGLSFIHARSDYAAAVAGPVARRLGVPMLWDCRGDGVAQFRERMEESGFRALAGPRARLLWRESEIAGRECNAACFVTESLRRLMAPTIGGKPSWIVPCLAAEEEFFFDPGLRRATRQKLQIGANEAVYVYSGSLVAYQCFPEAVATFRDIVAKESSARLIVLSPDVAGAQRATSGLPRDRVICGSANLVEVNAYLNAADYGMLLRDATPVNHVAFPTKFAEYCLAGLQVMMKTEPVSCVKMARKLGNYVPATGVAPARLDLERRAQLAKAAARQLGRGANLDGFRQIYESLAKAGSA